MKKTILLQFKKVPSASLKYFLTIIIVLGSLSLFSQTAAQPEANNSSTIFSNTLFNVLLGVIILLVIIIAVLGSVLKNVAEAVKEKRKSSTNKILGGVVLLFFATSSNKIVAQNAIQVTNSSYSGISSSLFYIMIAFIVLEIVIIAVLINSIQFLLKKELDEVRANEEFKKEEPSFLEKINASVAIEHEADILFDHDYDGIRELDNDLPPWWKYGFYVTILFAFVYLITFHVTKTGDLQIAEYNKSIALAKEAKELFQKNSANSVTENNVKLITDKTKLDEGETVFKENCFACHGKLGEGGVGPNLTDNYWIHGGSIKDLFTTIKYGWPDKGMKSWQADLSPLKINEVASYIIVKLKGTNPPNGKAPQGEIYVEKSDTKNDSTNKDSLNISLKIDSAKIDVKK